MIGNLCTNAVCAAVRTGNLAKFNQALEQFGEKFQTDGTYTLIIRLRHNVIKTGEPITGRVASDITAWLHLNRCRFPFFTDP